MHSEFRAALAAAGIIPPAEIMADGKIHRCKVDGHRGKPGAYRLTPDGQHGGWEDWTSGAGWQRWDAARTSQLTPDEVVEMHRAHAEQLRARRAEERRDALAAARHAERMWGDAAEGPHPYLDRKGVASNGTRVYGADLLLVPMRAWDGRLASMQTIDRDGTKLFLRGGRLKGSSYWLRRGGETGPTIYVCEGFATGATIHVATRGAPVLLAFACSNLLPVCRLVRANLPKARIVVCADNDHRTEGNPGLTKGREAASAIGARLAWPDGIDGTDFNDLMIEQGIDAVTEQLQRRRAT